MNENNTVVLKLVCPICGGLIWERTEHGGEFRCIECKEEFYCESMLAVSEEIKEDF